MWSLIKSLFTQFAIVKILLKSLGSLAWLVPLAFILKAIGLPMLMLLGVLALPLLLLLLVLGLPILLVMMMGGALLSVTGWIVSVGFFALKIAIPVMLLYWVLRWWWSPNRSEPNGTMDTPPPATAT